MLFVFMYVAKGVEIAQWFATSFPPLRPVFDPRWGVGDRVWWSTVRTCAVFSGFPSQTSMTTSPHEPRHPD